MTAKITSLESITIKNPVLQSQENSESDLFTLSLPYKDGTLATTGDVSALSESTTSAIEELTTRVNGATQTLVFDTVEDMNEWLSDPTNTDNLPVGSNLYIKDLSSPDYWWTGEGVEELETEKVDLTQYVTKTGNETLSNKIYESETLFSSEYYRYSLSYNNEVKQILIPIINGNNYIINAISNQALANKKIYDSNRLHHGTLKSKSNYTITFPDKNCTLATTDDINNSNGGLDSNDQLTNSAGAKIQFPTTNTNTSVVTVQYAIFQNVNIFNTDYFDYFPHLSAWSGLGQKGLLSIQKFIYGNLNYVSMNVFSLSCWTSAQTLSANTNYKITDVITKTDNYDPIILGQAFGFMQSDYVPSMCGVVSLTQQGIYLSTSRTIDVHTRIICNGTFPGSEYSITTTNATYKNI